VPVSTRGGLGNRLTGPVRPVTFLLVRVTLALLILHVTCWAVPAGWLEIRADTADVEVYLDDRVLLPGAEGVVVEETPGKHFVSLYPPRLVYLAFREDAPEHFWDKLRLTTPLGDEYGLISSYERGAVRVGTKWVYVVPEETLAVSLSSTAADETYNRDSSGVLGTFLIITGLVGVGMVISTFLAKLD
jgi:hypothetical protein